MLVLFFRVIILYFLILVTLRLMGKRESGQLQPFDLVVNIIIAELACGPLSDVNVPLMAGILPVAELLFLQLSVSYLCMRSRKIRRLICGEAVCVIKDGKINSGYMDRMLITVDDLSEIIRCCGIRDINAVDNLIIETNGKATVTEKCDSGIITTLIENGKIIFSNLAEAGLSVKDIEEAMRERNICGPEDVFWGFYYGGKYFFIKKEEK